MDLEFCDLPRSPWKAAAGMETDNNGSWKSGRKGGENCSLVLPKRDGAWRLELGMEQEGLRVGPELVGSRCSEFPSRGSGDFGIVGLAGRILQDNQGMEKGPRVLQLLQSQQGHLISKDIIWSER